MTQISEGERIVKLMLFVRENGPVSFAAIRRHFPAEYGGQTGNEQSARRRFERDKKTLQEFGIFLDVDGKQHYTFDTSRSIAAPLTLTDSQISLLRMLCGALLEDRDYPFKEDLRMVLVKLGDELDIPDMLPQLAEGAGSFDGAPETPGFSKIRKAISNRKRLSFDYSNSNGRASKREVEPFGGFFLRGVFYVVAFDPAAADVRYFRIDRMSKIKVNANAPNSPDFEERPFAATDYYGLPFQFGEEDATARIRLSGNAATRAASIILGQGELDHDGDDLIWTVTCRDTRMLAQWCIENGPEIRILEPAAAARDFTQGLQTFLERLDTEAEASV